MEVYTSDSSDTDSREQKTLDYSRMNLYDITLEDDLYSETKQRLKSQKDIEILLVNNNRLKCFPTTIKTFVNLRTLDLSYNCLTELPAAVFSMPFLVTLVAKNNQLTNQSLPKAFTHGKNQQCSLKELNLSGNLLTHFPEQLIEMRQLKYLYMGGNKITAISKDIWKMQSLQVLSIGGNLITEVPESVGLLTQLQALVLCDNLIESLPSSIARLKTLKSLLLHKNRLKHLPRDIVALKNLAELSLRDNPLVVRFVQDMALNPPSLMELSARIVKSNGLEVQTGDAPQTLLEYLSCANCCVNPNCKGVFFDNRVEHIKFVDFCGKYRVPLLQYLCSSKCIEPEEEPRPHSSSNASRYMMRKVLLG
ncbi:leucine-rich repeat-containing protein 58 [Stomoxys calcitrans]|uniref:Leucine-rich repeat-containing protein 58 n=1 Tax=Stomoxys calcitrans TaxID=35570 RepID=A0A1I8PYS4_STOCA|nr:leucine-rich repeat-containing protein 58 [Stomoxys calcitrans]